jgi:hypothetical protein
MSLLDPPQSLRRADPDELVAGIVSSANRFERIDLAEVERMRLMDRVDTKYTFDVGDLSSVLEELGDAYRVLDIGGRVLHSYENQYFDTVDFGCYQSHHNADLPRFKFRYRRYVDTDTTYFEIKEKTNKGRTNKVRVPVDRLSSSLDDPARALIHEVAGDRGWDAADLVPTVRATFFRLTIGCPDVGERATIDMCVQLDLGGDRSVYDAVAICELKQATASRQSALAEALKRRGVRPRRMTKYCLGVLAARPEVKANDFKPMIRAVIDLADPVR